MLNNSIECFETITSDNSPINPKGLKEELFLGDRRFNDLRNSLKTKLLHIADENGISTSLLEKHREHLDDAKAYVQDVQGQLQQYRGINNQVMDRLPEYLYFKTNIDNLSKVVILSVSTVLASIKKNRDELEILGIKTLQNDLDEANAILQHFCRLSTGLKSEEEMTQLVEVIKSLSLEILSDEKTLKEKMYVLRNGGSESRIGFRLSQESLLDKIQTRIAEAVQDTNPRKDPFIYVTDRELRVLERICTI
ncbi:MAG: hypothetical protein ACI8RA_002148 [Chlamydiales bacterium]